MERAAAHALLCLAGMRITMFLIGAFLLAAACAAPDGDGKSYLRTPNAAVPDAAPPAPDATVSDGSGSDTGSGSGSDNGNGGGSGSDDGGGSGSCHG